MQLHSMAQPGALSARRSAAHGTRLDRVRRAQCTPLAAVAARADGGMKTSRWRLAFPVLVEKKVKAVSPAEAAGLMRWPRNYVLVDVRRADQFAAFHAKGAHPCSRSAPLYQLIDTQSGSPLQLLRALAFSAQNVDAVEDAPSFLDDLRAATSGAAGVIFADAEGGSLEVTPQRPYGQVCRALIGAYTLLEQLGYRGAVLHLDGGLNAWFAEDLEGEGTDGEWTPSGRTPSSARAPPRLK